MNGFFAPSVQVTTQGHVSLIQGASRGIGLELVRQLLERKDLRARSGGRVVATCRNPALATELQALQSVHGQRLLILRLDVTDEESILAAARAVSDRMGRLDLLVNSSGVLHVPGKLAPETAIAGLTEAAMLQTYRVNAMGPMLVLKALAPLLGATATGKGRDGQVAATVVANLSARVSSIKENRLGGWHSYRASKAALNMLTKTAAVEFARDNKPIICLLLHPGTVATDLSRPFNRNVPPKMLFTPETSVKCLLDLICRATMNDSGKLFTWDGSNIDW